MLVLTKCGRSPNDFRNSGNFLDLSASIVHPLFSSTSTMAKVTPLVKKKSLKKAPLRFLRFGSDMFARMKVGAVAERPACWLGGGGLLISLLARLRSFALL